MPDRGEDGPRSTGEEPSGEEPGDGEGYDAAEQLRRAVEQQRHAAEARRHFEAMPLYRARHEDDGTVSVCRKAYDYWPARPPAAATVWRVLSNHQSFEQAERRLLHIASPPVYYDGRGRLVRAPPSGE